GARPIALLNSLRFGDPKAPKTKYLVKGVVSGIAGYGNCMGIPTVGGEVFFDPSYNGNNLVNAMCVGLVKKDKIFRAKAAGIGNPVFYVGSKTGKDGIHGATMASDVFEEGSEEKRPTVQVGDPFTEKLLLEACMELFEGDDLVGIQDMGAAGLTCSTFEMASNGNVGIDLDLSKVPLRETGMTPYDIMLSESQERMLFVAKKGAEKRVEQIFRKWGLDVACVGTVVKGETVKVFQNGNLVAEIPAHPISTKAPCYLRPRKKPEYLQKTKKLNGASIPVPRDLNKVLETLMGQPGIASKQWVYRQYDHMVGTDTVILPGSDAAVLRIKGTQKGIAMTTDVNSTLCYLDPYQGAMMAVAEAARNIVCSGAKPLAVTDCLNFGNPENPEILWQFEQAIKGISQACQELGTPVVSGNVSLYNESFGKAIYPTPSIGMVGLLKDVKNHCTQWFKEKGDLIVLIGPLSQNGLAGSEYLKVIHGKVLGEPAPVALNLEKKVQTVVLSGIEKGWVRSAHDCSEGGLAVTLAESCISGPKLLGAEISLKAKIRGDALLFGEAPSRIVVSVSEKNLKKLTDLIQQIKCPFLVLGKVGGKRLTINDQIGIDLTPLEKIWKEGFEKCAV
ncbi:MAG: phosphoribosylformylglycinamidine synthase subunit PurL, partial [bacterium]|nr:phosphoribosylformylglycinamidine synthase subunit PurL [bacterium]